MFCRDTNICRKDLKPRLYRRHLQILNIFDTSYMLTLLVPNSRLEKSKFILLKKVKSICTFEICTSAHPALHQIFIGQAGKTVIGNNEVVKYVNIQHPAGIDQFSGELDILLAGFQVSGGMVMYQYNPAGLVL